MSTTTAGGGTVTVGAPAPPSSGGATSGSQESISHKLHLPWWPEGDPGKLRDAARAYRSAATALTDAAEQAQRGIGDVTSSNSGAAIDAMSSRWSSVYYGRTCLTSPSDGAPALDNAIAACTMLASACDEYAQHIDDARHKLEELAAELVAGAVIGGLLTFVTAGLSDAAAAANAARVVTAALELADTVGSFVTVAFRIGGLAIQGALVGAGSDVAMQAVRISTHEQSGFSFSELGESAGMGAVLNPALAGAGAALGRAPALASRLGATLDDLTGLGSRMSSGAERLSGARSALAQRLGALAGDDTGSISVDLATLGLTRIPRPAWLERMFTGTAWHRAQQTALKIQDAENIAELYVLKPVVAGTKDIRPDGYNIVDNYNPVTQQITSMKFTQLSQIQEGTAKAYLKELADKYQPRTPIAPVSSTPDYLHGQQLRGQMNLLVPKQIAPIPADILAYAKLLKIRIMQEP